MWGGERSKKNNNIAVRSFRKTSADEKGAKYIVFPGTRSDLLLVRSKVDTEGLVCVFQSETPPLFRHIESESGVLE